MKLTILRGISGSGKSTIASALEASGARVVSRDAIRIGLFGVEFDPKFENDVTLVEHAILAAYLKAGYDVVSDNTNIEWKYVKAIAKIGYRYGAEVAIETVFVDLETAKKRNDHRAMLGGRFVPHDIITKQYDRFKKTMSLQLDRVNIPEPYNGTPGKPAAFLVDIDGTLAHMNGKRGPFDWKNVGVDDVDHVISNIVGRIADASHAGYEHMLTIVMSGRDEVSRGDTEQWLNDNYIHFDHLFMRPAGDFRPDNLIKEELFDTYVRNNFDVQFVLDDRDQVVDMWRRMGLTCLQVAPGDF